jgi:peroxiredoxin-like protein
MAKIHEYPVQVQWAGGRDGQGKATTQRTQVGMELRVSQATNPEELLTSAIAACYSITFGIIATNRKLPLVNVETNAQGEVEENGPTFKYTKITLRPVITLSHEATEDHIKMAEDMAHKADAYCIVTNAVRGTVEIAVDPTVVRA